MRESLRVEKTEAADSNLKHEGSNPGEENRDRSILISDRVYDSKALPSTLSLSLEFLSLSRLHRALASLPYSSR